MARQHYTLSKSFLAISFLILRSNFFAKEANAQEYQKLETYNSQIVFGVNFNTNGGLIGGVTARYSKHIRGNQYRYFGLEIINVRHPKESSYITNSGSIYTDFKANSFLPIRLQYGREFLLFQPAEEEGVQIDLILGAGLSIGILKPYMLEYDYGFETRIEQFDPDKTNGIVGKGPFFSGFDKAKIIPGLNVKAGVSFEFEKFRYNVTGIEAGFLLEAFSSKIEMMKVSSLSPEKPQSRAVYSSLYITIFFGFRG
jgi:hypothetical protein